MTKAIVSGPVPLENVATQEEAAFETTDVANADRIVREFRDDLRWVNGLGFLGFTGTHWERSENRALRVGRQLGRIIQQEAAELLKRAAKEQDDAKHQDLKDRAAGLLKWGARSETERQVRSALTLARSFVEVPIEALDSDPWLLNVRNGTLDLRTGALRPHSRGDHITRLADVAYDPDARSELWDAFIERVIPDPEIRGFLQRAFGYALTGSTIEDVFFILWGSGSNGKSTLLEAIRRALGDYAMHTPAETLLAGRDTAIPNDVARLRGARFVSSVETGEGRRLNENKIKSMTGGDRIAARYMRQEWFEFDPTFKLFLATNYRPQVRGNDHAMWRRIRLIPFTETITDDEIDLDLQDKLRAEAPAILAWLVQGCMAWQAEGLNASTSVLAATNSYRREEDLLGQFLEAECDVSDRDALEAVRRGEAGAQTLPWVSSKVLYDAYCNWMEGEGERPLSKKALGMRLGLAGLMDERGTGGARGWRGIRLRDRSDV